MRLMNARSERTVLVTGANSGIGLASTLHVAKLGFHAVGSVRSKAKASHVADVAASAGVSVETLVMDVTDAERCATVIGDLHPWAVVNNAGYSGVGAIEDITDEEARLQLETMVVAPMRLARLSLSHMREAGGGRIVNISSIYGLTTTPFSGWYQASKHALEAASDALRIEVARDGIQVVLVEPGGVKTHIWEQMEVDLAHRSGSSYETQYQQILALLAPFRPLMVGPEAVARVVGKALTARAARARYLVGRDAQAIAASQALIPAGVRDRVARALAGL
jgi:NAD(P)-dependent dehydrogenase (short-subunit alcohol dehydrogenase family)